ncbi:putative zinc finger BED domain-containing protein 4-like [Apostichopus japonicus]|uniref:Putative zinc finger BED domain-containing protein 4-like n=1 Tax=Stichopus japonicus TaxID=307972 RepID=A0A2G8KSC6_STIJA|nr:putative zinc finger BED domain-containing protein 4-like [Apostichopus japonicus]
MPRIATSKIWDYFSISPNDITKAKCIACGTLISRGGKTSATFTSTNLKNHLKNSHTFKFKEFQESQNKADELKRKLDADKAGPSSSQSAKRVHQMQLTQMVDKVTKWQPTDSHTIRVNSKLAEMIVLDLQPFSITRNVGFQRFCDALDPRYPLPSDTHISRKLIPEMYDRVKTRMKEEITRVKHIAFTTDIWSSTVGSNSLVSLTGHWIGLNFERKHGVLNAASFVGRHTADAIKRSIEGMLATWKIGKDQVVTILRDNAANVIAGLTQTGIDHQSCLIHTLQLVINDAIKVQRSVNDMLTVARGIAGHFNHSPLAHHRLSALQTKHNIPSHHILQDVSTRWNSSFYMLERILEQKNALVEYASLYDMPVMTANQWNLASKLVSTLRRFEELTRQASMASATISMVIPSVSMLRRSLSKHEDDQGIQTLTSTMLASLNRRFTTVEENKLLVLACFLDPRFKTIFFSDEATHQRATDWLEDEVAIDPLP